MSQTRFFRFFIGMFGLCLMGTTSAVAEEPFSDLPLLNEGLNGKETCAGITSSDLCTDCVQNAFERTYGYRPGSIGGHYDFGYDTVMHDYYFWPTLKVTFTNNQCTWQYSRYCFTGSYTNKAVSGWNTQFSGTNKFRHILSLFTRTPSGSPNDTKKTYVWRVVYDPWHDSSYNFKTYCDSANDCNMGEVHDLGDGYYAPKTHNGPVDFDQNFDGPYYDGPYDNGTQDCITEYKNATGINDISFRCGGFYKKFYDYISNKGTGTSALKKVTDDLTDSFFRTWCVRCGGGYTSNNVGSGKLVVDLNEDICTECSAGKYGTGISCRYCPKGTYAASASSASCTICGVKTESTDSLYYGVPGDYKQLSGLTTASTGSTSEKQCLLPSGAEVNFCDEYGCGKAILSQSCTQQ